MFTVGQLAKRTGVSIRTLHYYEKMSLLQPTRNDSGYRLYGQGSIIRLQQISILKKMRFTLNEISGIIGQAHNDETENMAEAWSKALEQQVAIVRQQKEDLQIVEHLLKSSQYAIRATGQVNIAELIDFIREIEQSPPPGPGRRKLFFTQEEQASLPINEFDNPLVMEWADILREINKSQHEPPTSAASQQLAARIAQYASQMFHGDEQLIEKFWTYITPNEGESSVLYGMTKDVMAYIDRIMDVYDQHK